MRELGILAACLCARARASRRGSERNSANTMRGNYRERDVIVGNASIKTWHHFDRATGKHNVDRAFTAESHIQRQQRPPCQRGGEEESAISRRPPAGCCAPGRTLVVSARRPQERRLWGTDRPRLAISHRWSRHAGGGWGGLQALRWREPAASLQLSH